MKTIQLICSFGKGVGKGIGFNLDELKGNQSLKDIILNSECKIARKYNAFILNEDCETYRQIDLNMLNNIIKDFV